MKTNKRQYVNENVVQTIKIIEALEGANFEPVTIEKIIERVGEIVELGKPLTWDKTRRVLITLEFLGWAIENDKKQWTLGAKVLRFSNRYSELVIANSNR